MRILSTTFSANLGGTNPHAHLPTCDDNMLSTAWYKLLMKVGLQWHRHRGSAVPALTLWMSFSMSWALGWCRCRRSSSSESSSSILVATMTRALRAHWSNHFSKCSKKPARSLRERPAIVTREISFHTDASSASPFYSFFLILFPTTLYLFVWVDHHSFSQTPC